MKSAIGFCALVSVLMVGCAEWCAAQDPDYIQQGIKAYGTYQAGNIDVVSMTNGNLTIHIPLVSYPQRGKLDLGYYLVYNNKNYVVKTLQEGDQQVTMIDFMSDSHFGVPLGSPLRPVADQEFITTETIVQE